MNKIPLHEPYDALDIKPPKDIKLPMNYSLKRLEFMTIDEIENAPLRYII